jgi:hypothetical protein
MMDETRVQRLMAYLLPVLAAPAPPYNAGTAAGRVRVINHRGPATMAELGRHVRISCAR